MYILGCSLRFPHEKTLTVLLLCGDMLRGSCVEKQSGQRNILADIQKQPEKRNAFDVRKINICNEIDI